MAVYLVSKYGSGADGTEAGGWDLAHQTLAAALTVASTAGDIIKVGHDHYEELAADIIFTALADISIICVNRTSGAQDEMNGMTAYIGSTSVNRAIAFAGAFKVFVRGLCLLISGTSGDSFQLSSSHGGQFVYERCKIWLHNTATSSRIYTGSTTGQRSYTHLHDCSTRLNNASQHLTVTNIFGATGGELSFLANSPDYAINSITYTTAESRLDGVDISAGSIAVVEGGAVCHRVILANCKIASGAAFMEAAITTPNLSAPEVIAYNTASGDQHYHLAHFNALGGTVMETGIYANDGALYDGTNHVTWKITTTANASRYSPYESPWIEKYHVGASAITPWLEILQDGSATALTNAEVWGDFSAQSNSGSPLASFVCDRAATLETPADQDAGVGLSGWTGESATAWSGKLVSPSITPAEIGMLRARVAVGKPSATIYVDPKIRL